MLSLLIVQVLAGTFIAALAGGFLLGHLLEHPSRETVRVVARRNPRRWTEVAWMVGTLVFTFWSFGVLLAPTYAYHWPATPDFSGSVPFQLIGFLVALVGGILFFAAVRALGRHMTTAIRVQEGHRLVQEGPYRYIRHPAYTAIVAGAGGLSALYLSPPLALVTILLGGVAVYRARLEENLLSSQEGFGKTYTDYVARTGRFLPRIRWKI